MKKLFLLVSGTLLMTACSATVEKQPETMVYINTGEVQCEQQGQTGMQTARLLTDNNIEVSQTQCGQMTDTVVAAVCGGVTTNINVHTIPTAGVETAKALGFVEVSTLKQLDDLGYAVNDCQE